MSFVSASTTVTDNYEGWLADIAARFAAIPATTPLFHTDAVDLNAAYLESFPADGLRQHYTCHTCRHFLERYGDLATIDSETGEVTSAVWDPATAPPAFLAAATRLKQLVDAARVVGVALSAEAHLGESPKGGYSHFSLPNRDRMHRGPLLTASQEAAQFRERFGLVSKALADYDVNLLALAVQLLQASDQGRTEVAIGPVRWLLALSQKCQGVNNTKRKQAIIWRAVAVAPAGFCHPNSSVAGTVLEDLASGASHQETMAKFAAKTAPLQYNRPTAAPSDGAIREAEKAFETLGLASALSRRIATAAEVAEACGDSAFWRPRPIVEATAPGAPPRIFDHVRQAQSAAAVPDLPRETMSWARFTDEVLPSVRGLEVQVPTRGDFTAITTATDPDAGPILGWDDAERRNPFAWFVQHGGSSAGTWGLSAGWTPVVAAVARPCHWHGRAWHKLPPRVLFVVAATAMPPQSRANIFPEFLQSHLRPFDAVVEAHNRACALVVPAGLSGFAVGVPADDAWSATIRVRTDGPAARVITIDRMK